MSDLGHEEVRRLHELVAEINTLAGQMQRMGFRVEVDVLRLEHFGEPYSVELSVQVLRPVLPSRTYTCATCRDGDAEPDTDWPDLKCPACGLDCLPF